MAAAAESRVSASMAMEEFSDRQDTDGICRRCGGLMVTEFCLDVLNSTGELDVMASRCVQCGDVVDPVILKNRQRCGVTVQMREGLTVAHSQHCPVAA